MSVVKAGEDFSANEREFILQALQTSDVRADGRSSRDARPLRVLYARGEAQASAEVQLGKTRVLTVVTSELLPPYPDRPTEGFLQLNVEYSPMAALGIDNARSAPALVEVDRVIERCLRQSRALDVEALCVVAGKKVWSLRCDVRVLDDGGNVVDAAALATVAALLHFRLPEVTITASASSDNDKGSKGKGKSGGAEEEKVTVHHSFEKEPSALPVHHAPLCVSFGLFLEGPAMIAALDPTNREEAVMGGRLTYAINAHKELCALQKLGGVPLAPTDMMRWCELAQAQVSEWHALLQESLAMADRTAKEDRLRAIRGTAPTAPSSSFASTAGGPGPPPQQPPPEAAASKEVAHLDFAELHVPIKVREESEKPPPPTAEEEGRRLRRLEKAAEDAEAYRRVQEQEQQEEEEERERAAAMAAAARATEGEEEEEEEEEEEGMDVVGEEEEEGVSAKRGRRRNGRDGDEEEEEEEETTAVLVSEFAAPAPAVAPSPPPVGGNGGGGSGGGRTALAARRAKMTLEGREEEEEEEDGEEGGGGGDLRAAVKKPRLSGGSGVAGRKKGGRRR